MPAVLEPTLLGTNRTSVRSRRTVLHAGVQGKARSVEIVIDTTERKVCVEETVYKERTAGGDIKVQAEEELDYAGRQCMDGIGGKPHSEATCAGGVQNTDEVLTTNRSEECTLHEYEPRGSCRISCTTN